MALPTSTLLIKLTLLKQLINALPARTDSSQHELEVIVYIKPISLISPPHLRHRHIASIRQNGLDNRNIARALPKQMIHKPGI